MSMDTNEYKTFQDILKIIFILGLTWLGFEYEFTWWIGVMIALVFLSL